MSGEEKSKTSLGHLLQHAGFAERDGKSEEAVRFFDRALQLDPLCKQVYNALGRNLRKLGRLDEAIKNYERAVALDPRYTSAYYNLAVAQATKLPDSLGQVVHQYRKVIELDPNHFRAHNNLANTLGLEESLAAESVGHYRLSLAINPLFKEAHNNLGGHYLTLANTAAAAAAASGTSAAAAGAAQHRAEACCAVREAASHFKSALLIDAGFNPSLLNLQRACAVLAENSPDGAADTLDSIMPSRPYVGQMLQARILEQANAAAALSASESRNNGTGVGQGRGGRPGLAKKGRAASTGGVGSWSWSWTETITVTKCPALAPRGEWQADASRPDCSNCSRLFSLFTRRHHCRFCGLLMCSRCVSWQVIVQRHRATRMIAAGGKQPPTPPPPPHNGAGGGATGNSSSSASSINTASESGKGSLASGKTQGEAHLMDLPGSSAASSSRSTRSQSTTPILAPSRASTASTATSSSRPARSNTLGQQSGGSKSSFLTPRGIADLASGNATAVAVVGGVSAHQFVSQQYRSCQSCFQETTQGKKRRSRRGTHRSGGSGGSPGGKSITGSGEMDSSGKKKIGAAGGGPGSRSSIVGNNVLPRLYSTIAEYDFEPQGEGQIALKKGNVVHVLGSADKDWMTVQVDDSVTPPSATNSSASSSLGTHSDSESETASEAWDRAQQTPRPPAGVSVIGLVPKAYLMHVPSNMPDMEESYRSSSEGGSSSSFSKQQHTTGTTGTTPSAGELATSVAGAGVGISSADGVDTADSGNAGNAAAAVSSSSSSSGWESSLSDSDDSCSDSEDDDGDLNGLSSCSDSEDEDGDLNGLMNALDLAQDTAGSGMSGGDGGGGGGGGGPRDPKYNRRIGTGGGGHNWKNGQDMLRSGKLRLQLYVLGVDGEPMNHRSMGSEAGPASGLVTLPGGAKAIKGGGAGGGSAAPAVSRDPLGLVSASEKTGGKSGGSGAVGAGLPPVIPSLGSAGGGLKASAHPTAYLGDGGDDASGMGGGPSSSGDGDVLGGGGESEMADSGSKKEWQVDFLELEIGHRIGAGNFGEVRQAVFRRQVVAVKLITRGAVTISGIRSFKHEMSLMAALRHENIVQFLGACTDPGRLSMVVEWCECSAYDLLTAYGSHPLLGSGAEVISAAEEREAAERLEHFGQIVALLSQSFSRGTAPPPGSGPRTPGAGAATVGGASSAGGLKTTSTKNAAARVAPRWIVAIARAVALGVYYLHCCKPPVLHRDLKSANVLVNKQGIPKISDFGLARVMEETTDQSGINIVGSVQWTAPEVLRGEPATVKSDVYSYGMLLVELITRQFPYPKMEAQHVEVGIITAMLPRPALPTACPHHLAALTQRCFAERPEDRPSFEVILDTFDAVGPGDE